MDRRNASELRQEDKNPNQARTTDAMLYPPYKTVRKLVFSNITANELIDVPHSARLQYRLLLVAPIIKASVDFSDSRITIIYNPKTASNIREKISPEEILQVLAKEGVHPDESSTIDVDYDYQNDFYSYAYNSPPMRERPPYGYKDEEWQKMKRAWAEKMERNEAKKKEKFKLWQEKYLASLHPEAAAKIKGE